MTSLKETPLLGGWLSQLQEQMQSDVDGHVQLKNMRLLFTVHLRSEHHRLSRHFSGQESSINFKTFGNLVERR